VIPHEVLSFIGVQLGVPADALLTYAARRQTRQEHMEALREIYGYKTFAGRGARDLRDWLFNQAEEARSNEDLAQRLVARCRKTLTILPAVSTIERLCADALVAAERRIETRIAEKLDNNARERLDRLLTELLDANVSRFIWLRQFEVGNNSGSCPGRWCRSRLKAVLSDLEPDEYQRATAGRLICGSSLICAMVSSVRYRARWTAHSSFCSSSSAPTRRTMASSFGKMPTTSVRRLISPLRRSIGLVTGIRSAVPMFGCDFVDRGVWCDHPGQRHREHEGAGRPMHTMSCELVLVAGRLCDSPGCAESANP